jgi:NAD(P)-dependent dehydrogenase (short-subunit alcohol dehydrogenase family)
MNNLDLFRLDGRTAIVTGGGRGLGRYMAEALSDAGANVVLCSRKKEPLEEVRSEIEARGRRARSAVRRHGPGRRGERRRGGGRNLRER